MAKPEQTPLPNTTVMQPNREFQLTGAEAKQIWQALDYFYQTTERAMKKEADEKIKEIRQQQLNQIRLLQSKF